MSEPASTHAEMRDAAAGYALGGLDAREAADLEAHLAECDSCRDYLRWLRAAVDVLPASVEQLEPPPALGERLLAIVRQEAAAGGDAASAARWPGRWRSWRGLAMRPATGLAALLVLAVGIGAGYLLGGSDEEHSVIAARVSAAAPRGAAAALVREDGEAMLEVEQMPPPRGEGVYKVWVRREGVMEPSTAFVPERDGSYDAAIDRSLEGADAVLVTEERDPRARRPTSPPLLRAPLG